MNTPPRSTPFASGRGRIPPRRELPQVRGFNRRSFLERTGAAAFLGVLAEARSLAGARGALGRRGGMPLPFGEPLWVNCCSKSIDLDEPREDEPAI